MVLIPQHKSDAQIKTPSAQLSGGGSISSSKRAQAGMIQAVEQVQDRLLQIKDFRQTTEANAFATEKLNGLKQQSQTDSDMNINVYDEEIAKIGSDASRNISGQLAKEEFMASYNRQAQATKWGIENDFRRKEIASTIALNKYNQDVLINSYPKMDEASQISAVATFKKQIEKGVELGIYTQEVADAELADTQKELNKAEATYAAQYTPDEFLENIEDYDVGENEKELKAMASNQQKKIKAEEKKVRKEIHYGNANTIVSGMVNQDMPLPSVNDINRLMGKDQVSQDFAKAYNKATTSAKLTRELADYDDTGFQSYAMDVFDSKDPDQIQQAIVNTLNGGGDGKVNQDEMVTLLQLSMVRDEEVKDGTSKIGEIGKSLMNLSPIGMTFNVNRMITDFNKAMADGKSPEEAKEVAVDNEQIRTNPDRSKYSVGDSVNTPLGLMYVHGYYPDGEPDVRPEKPNK